MDTRGLDSDCFVQVGTVRGHTVPIRKKMTEFCIIWFWWGQQHFKQLKKKCSHKVRFHWKEFKNNEFIAYNKGLFSNAVCCWSQKQKSKPMRTKTTQEKNRPIQRAGHLCHKDHSLCDQQTLLLKRKPKHQRKPKANPGKTPGITLWVCLLVNGIEEEDK